MRYFLMVICLMCLVGCGSDIEKKDTFQKATGNISISDSKKSEDNKNFGKGAYAKEHLESQGLSGSDNVMDIIDKAMEQ
ncbi:MAG: hypothetical protein JEZ04_22465 [Spirochaetales bacterium]|nr:hypothetical protein [Spirochaetales bacterium]